MVIKKTKILIYFKLFFAGGTEHSILKLIKKLYNNFDIIVAYDEDSTENVLSEIRNYANVIDLNKIEKIEVDKCIICSHSKLGSFDKLSKKIIANHYYYWCHLVLFDMFPKLEFEKSLINNIEKFICVSETVKENIIEKYPYLKSKCIIIENYLDVEEIKNKSEELLEDILVDKTKLNIISVSRIVKDKRFWKNENYM